MIGHYNPRAKFILTERYSTPDRPRHYGGDFGPNQILGTFACGIEIAIHPDEDLAVGTFPGRRKQRMGQASIQVPCDKEPFAGRKDVWQSASGETHRGIVRSRGKNSLPVKHWTSRRVSMRLYGSPPPKLMQMFGNGK